MGRAMAQAVSRRPVTVEARVRGRVSPCGISGGRNNIETVFIRVLLFAPVSVIPPWLSILIWGMNNRSVGGRNPIPLT
jgi:hypothetical protein